MVLAPEHPLVGALTAAAWPDGTDPRWTGGAATPAEAVAAYQRQASRRSELDRQTEGRDKTGVWLGVTAVNPVNGRELPVFIADYVLTGYGTGAIMAVPGEDARDCEFAEAFGLPVVRTVQPPEDFDGGAYTGAGPMINSSNDEISLDGLDKADRDRDDHRVAGRARPRRGDDHLQAARLAVQPAALLGRAVPDRLRRETTCRSPSRTRCCRCCCPRSTTTRRRPSPTTTPTPRPEPPLSRATEWTTVELDLGDGPQKYRRETNTMPNWAGSCWYYLRYLDPGDDEQMVDPELERYWLGPREPGDVGGVDLYVGGVEHAVLHLLYARFWHKVLFDLGYVSSEEPFRRLVNQGYISAFAYTDERGFYVPAAEVVEKDGQFFYEGKPVNREYGKIGKSLKNMVTPDEMIGAYGADTFRVYEMSTGPLDQSRPWETKAVVGSQRLLQRIWRVVVDEETGAVRAADVEPVRGHPARAAPDDRRRPRRLRDAAVQHRHRPDHRADQPPDLGLRRGRRRCPRSVAEPLVLLVAPLAPHIAEEMWARLGHDESLGLARRSRWPTSAGWSTTRCEVAVQVNGKVRAQVTRAGRRRRRGAGGGRPGRRADRRLPGRRDRAPRRRRPRPAGQLRPRLRDFRCRKPSGRADADDLVAVGVAAVSRCTTRDVT